MTKNQYHTSTVYKSCVITHYIKSAIEDWNKKPITHQNKNKCIWNLEKEC